MALFQYKIKNDANEFSLTNIIYYRTKKTRLPFKRGRRVFVYLYFASSCVIQYPSAVPKTNIPTQNAYCTQPNEAG